MDNQERKSNWDELALELGAQIAPEVLEREQAVATKYQSVTPETEKSATERSPLPKRPAAGWDNLASEFGLASQQPIVPTAQEPTPVLAAEEEEPVEVQRSRRDRANQRQRGRSERSQPSAEQRDRHRKRQEEQEPRNKQPERQSGRATYGHESRAASEIETSDREVRDTIEPETMPSPPKPRDESARGAAVSLWHKIFGSPAQQAAKLAEKTPIASEQSVEREIAEERTSALTTDVSVSSGEAVVDDIEGREEEHDSLLEKTGTEEISTERKRGRRRRRGGRGRKSTERQATSRETASLAGSDENAGDIHAISDERSYEDSTAKDTSQLESIADGEDVDDDVTNSSRSKAAQRAIPSWDEVIGFIVDSNLQNRSQRRPPSRSSTRGKSARG